MAPWGDAKLFFCILFVYCCCRVIQTQVPFDCCLTVKNKTIGRNAVIDYHRQISGQGCSLNAMILVTRRKFKLCVPLNEQWVQVVVKYVDGRKNPCKVQRHKSTRTMAALD